MRRTSVFVVALLTVISQHCVHNIFNLPGQLIEEAMREYRRKYMKTDETHYVKRSLLNEYDFIVVGSGPGGAVVANRLSENPNWKVLLLEAGREDSIVTEIPIFVSYLQFTDFNWGMSSEAQPSSCLGLTDQRCKWPRGKGLGGTSLINYMIYTRGNRADYDLWAEMGNPGWSYDEVLPYFLKSEDMRIPEFQNSPHHQRNGYLPIEHIKYRTKLAEAFLSAGQEMGYNIIDYNNGEIPSGFAPVQEMMFQGHRASSEKAFIRPIKGRDNLHVSVKSRVTKVLINPLTKSAEGVEVVRDRKTYKIKARKEVILSAGSMSTPQLLMLSGVGPRYHLEELGIPVVHDLPGVGQNINEHVSYCGLTFLTNESYVGVVENRLYDIKLLDDFLKKGSGPYALPGAVEGLAYINTKLNDDKRGRPDIELIFASGSLTSDGGGTVRNGIGVTDEIYEQTFRPVDSRDNWTVWPMILHPKSRGYMKLKSKNPWHWPKFYANYFEHEHDLDTIVEGIKFAIKMSQTKAFQRYGSYLNHLPLKPCIGPDSPQNSDNYWRCAVRYLTTTLHHQSGTCKMGPPSDPGAVVDNKLQVYGVKNLRVVDASVIPQLITAHTTAPTYMIGEKGSDLIKSSWSGSYNPSPSYPSYPNYPANQPNYPINQGVNYPSYQPSNPSTNYPSNQPSNPPTNYPTNQPSNPPTNYPTNQPSNPPTNYPTNQPSNPPTNYPTNQPSNPPTNYPTNQPSNPPINYPTNQPSNPPTNYPTNQPSNPPTNYPTNQPSNPPTNYPSNQPSNPPTNYPSNQPSNPASNQIGQPSTDFNYPTNQQQISNNVNYPQYPVGSGNQNPVTNVVIPGSNMPIPVPVPNDNRGYTRFQF